MSSIFSTRSPQRNLTKVTKLSFETFVPTFVSFVRTIFLLSLCSLHGLSFANNLHLSNLQLSSPTQLTLTISWENSWNLDAATQPGNHDAVWIFVKIKSGSNPWSHVHLAADSSLHSAAPPLQVTPSFDGIGVMISRVTLGAGDIPPTQLSIALVNPITSSQAEIKVFGIEMVEVSAGSYFLGDGSSYHHFRDSVSGNPILIDSEASLTGIAAGDTAVVSGRIPDAYPKGFAAFYQMKYEISQSQYCDFLNTLSYQQQESRTEQPPTASVGTVVMSSFAPFRNGIVILDPGIQGQSAARYGVDNSANGIVDEANDGQPRACNFLNWQDVSAYLDWAGLRPMTELEYEKSCRGPEVPVAGEFAWGTSQVIDANTILMDGTIQETVSEQATATAGLASHGYFGPSGPLRCGFGGTDSSDRLQLGAGYFGAAELSGNLWEPCVTVDAVGLAFTGTHGNGELAIDGDADVPHWPVTAGGILRGGAHNSGIIGNFRDLAISDRFYHDLHPAQRRNTTGGRGVRTMNP